ncbi:MAG: hypothetical protein KBA31_17080 [Alphaproteobacteria bacterium]|nr:hypothetical protein [Alphaproteobacteria bacterium]
MARPLSRRCLFLAALAVVVGNVSAWSGELGQIKRFVAPYPIQTYERNGSRSETVLTAENTPPSVADIAVDGIWPDNRMLLISFPTIDDGQAYFIDLSAVEMVDPQRWNDMMKGSGPMSCLRRTFTTRSQRSVSGTSAAPKGFKSPCPR